MLNRLQALRAYKPSEQTEKKLLLLSILIMIIGLYLSVGDNPGILSGIDWRAIAIVILIGIPLTALGNALEFIVSGRMVGVTFSLLRALRVTVIGSAANMLPLPGSTIVRVAALKVSGVGIKQSTAITLLVALVWIGVSFLYAGIMIGQFQAGALAWFMGLPGLLVLIAAGFLTRTSNASLWYYSQIVVIKSLMVLIDAARIYYCFLALNLEVLFVQASAFVIAGVVGSAVSIVPAGLGVRELVSAGLAPVVGLSVSAGFLSATLNRIIGLTTLVPVAGMLTLVNSEKKLQDR